MTETPKFKLEVVRAPEPGRAFRAALFDFDGTLSLIRSGWQDVMVPYFYEELAKVADSTKESEADVMRIVRDFIDQITGKQTIYQCMRLADEITARGGRPLEPLAYKKEYLRRLQIHTKDRVARLENGDAEPDEYVVPGARRFLERLRGAGVKLYLASGTDEVDVKREAELLRLTSFFDGGIYGAQDDYKRFSKAMVIDQIIDQNKLEGAQLIGFGDGYVEIENVRAIGGYAIGMATLEAAPGGVDEWKRARLLQAGADAIAPDYSEPEALFNFINA